MRTDTLHPSEEELERYALGRLSEAVAAPIEEHLLLCAACRNKLEALDEYVAAMRAALTETESAAPAPSREPVIQTGWHFRLPRPVWATALAAAALVLVALPVWRGNPEPYSVELVAYRGGDPLLQATAPTGRLLELHLDLRGMDRRSELVSEVADSSGLVVWENVIEGSGETAVADLPKDLYEGQYWVRLYAPAPLNEDRGELLREFGLRIE